MIIALLFLLLIYIFLLFIPIDSIITDNLNCCSLKDFVDFFFNWRKAFAKKKMRFTLFSENGFAWILFNLVRREIPVRSSPLRNFCLNEFATEITLTHPYTKTRLFNKHKTEIYCSLFIVL